VVVVLAVAVAAEDLAALAEEAAAAVERAGVGEVVG
jgi:hypothetical protein